MCSRPVAGLGSGTITGHFLEVRAYRVEAMVAGHALVGVQGS